MPLMKMKTVRLILATALAVQLAACAQTNVPGTNAAAVVPAPGKAMAAPSAVMAAPSEVALARAPGMGDRRTRDGPGRRRG